MVSKFRISAQKVELYYDVGYNSSRENMVRETLHQRMTTQVEIYVLSNHHALLMKRAQNIMGINIWRKRKYHKY